MNGILEPGAVGGESSALAPTPNKRVTELTVSFRTKHAIDLPSRFQKVRTHCLDGPASQEIAALDIKGHQSFESICPSDHRQAVDQQMAAPQTRVKVNSRACRSSYSSNQVCSASTLPSGIDRGQQGLGPPESENGRVLRQGDGARSVDPDEIPIETNDLVTTLAILTRLTARPPQLLLRSQHIDS